MSDERSLPSAGQMWWRAMLRARMEASSRHARPAGTTRPAVAGAAAIGLLVVLAVVAWPWVAMASGWLMTAAARIDPATAQTSGMLLALARWSVPIVIGASAIVLVAAAGIYLALTD